MECVDVLARKHGLDACLAENQRRHVEQFVPFAPLAKPGAADPAASSGR
jgi:hypothetical protein